MTITISDQFAVFWWVRDRAERLTSENLAEKKDNPSYAEFAKECEAQGKALAMLELARDILSVEWPNQLADIAEKERLKNVQVDRMAQLTKEMIEDEEPWNNNEDVLQHGGEK